MEAKFVIHRVKRGSTLFYFKRHVVLWRLWEAKVQKLTENSSKIWQWWSGRLPPKQGCGPGQCKDGLLYVQGHELSASHPSDEQHLWDGGGGFGIFSRLYRKKEIFWLGWAKARNYVISQYNMIWSKWLNKASVRAMLLKTVMEAFSVKKAPKKNGWWPSGWSITRWGLFAW